VTRPNILVGALAAVGVGTLLWCAWLILAADLTLGTSIAAWGLWLLVAAAVTTLVAYVRELGRHRTSVTRGGSWKPLPSLVLVWIGGATAVGVFLFMLPSSAAVDSADQTPKADGSLAKGSTDQLPSATSAGDPRVSPTTVSRSKPRTTPTGSPTTSPTAASRSRSGSTTSSPTPKRTTTTTSTPTTSTTSPTPIVTITLPTGQGSPTTKPHPH
jgi:cell division septation protein DedD